MNQPPILKNFILFVLEPHHPEWMSLHKCHKSQAVASRLYVGHFCMSVLHIYRGEVYTSVNILQVVEDSLIVSSWCKRAHTPFLVCSVTSYLLILLWAKTLFGIHLLFHRPSTLQTRNGLE